MKLICSISFLLIFFALSAVAEPQFPEFNSLSPESQKAWGYTIQRNSGSNPGFYIHIPEKTAKLYKGARLYIRDAQFHTLVETNMAFYPSPDGGYGINVNLFESFHGIVDLLVYTDNNPAAMYPFDFGGLSFRLSNAAP